MRKHQSALTTVFASFFFVTVEPSDLFAKETGQTISRDMVSSEACSQSRVLVPWENDVNIHLSGFSKDGGSRFEYVARSVADEFPHQLSFSKNESANLVVFHLKEKQTLPDRAEKILKTMYPHDPDGRAKSLSDGNGVVDYTLTLGFDEEGIAIGGFGVLRATFSKVEFEMRSADLMAILLGVQVREGALSDKSGNERLQAVKQAVGAAYVCSDVLKPN